METMLKIKAGIMRVLSIVIIFLFAFMTVIGTYQIVTRYFFNKPSTVSEELLTYSFTWMALLASAYVCPGSCCAGIWRYLYYQADHDPDYRFPACSYGLYLRDRTCYRYSDHALQRYECDPGFKEGF